MAVILTYFSVFSLLGLLLFLAGSFLVKEIQQFSQFLPQYLERIAPYLQNLNIPVSTSIESYINVLGGSLSQITGGATDAVFAVFGGLFSTLFIITVAIFISLEQNLIERVLLLFFPKRYEAYILRLWERCQQRVNGWFLIRIFTCIFVGSFTFFALFLFNAKYPFSLGLLAGVLNFIPIVGPILTGALIFLILFVDNASRAFFGVLAFTLIQQVENNVITPLLSKRIFDVSPVLVLVALAVGGRLWGALGAILGIPVLVIVFEFLKEFLQRKKDLANKDYE